MTDTYVERTSKSWGSRIVESITGVLFGILFVFGSLALLFWNEGRAVQTARSLAEGGKVVIDVAPDALDPANENLLIHVSGDAKATARLADPEFEISGTALRLVRIAEMYQWDEDKHEDTEKSVGGSEQKTITYSYSKKWSDRTIDSQSFKQRDNHVNPPKKYNRLDVSANDATLGAYRLDPPVLNLLPTNGLLRVGPEAGSKLKARIPNAQVLDGKIYIGADPDKPQIGDYQISYVVAPAGPVSVIGRQTGAGFTPYQTKAGDRLLMAVPGLQPAADMFKEAEQENRIVTWVIRFVGIFVMWFGAVLVLRPLVVVADVVPLIGNILGAGAALVALAFTVVVAPAVMALAWLWYRPVVSVVVLAIGLGVGFGLHRLAARRHAARALPPAAPPAPVAAA